MFTQHPWAFTWLVVSSLLLGVPAVSDASGLLLNQGGLVCTSEAAAAWALGTALEHDLDGVQFRRLVTDMRADGHCTLTAEDWPIVRLVRRGARSSPRLRVIEVEISEGGRADHVWTTQHHIREGE